MKKKYRLAQGAQIDLNAEFNLGGVDTSVEYSIPEHLQQIISINSAGVISALEIGTAIVEIKDPSSNALLGSIAIQVLEQDDVTLQEELESGDKDFQVEILDLPDFNTPVNVSGVDEGNNTIAITFSNTRLVRNRGFHIGIRDVGTSANADVSLGRHEFASEVVFTGMGEHSYNLQTNVASGNYEVYVHDLEDDTVGFSQISFSHYYPPINTILTINAVDSTDNNVSITFTNAMIVQNRNFQVGIRAVGSQASSTSAAGRYDYQIVNLTGLGPHTVNVFTEVPDGIYEAYVEDLTDIALGAMQVTINTEDLTPPSALISGNWSPYTNLISLNWSASDAETGVVSKTLDLRSQDGLSVLINNQNVTSDADSVMTAYIEPNDKTYVATFAAVNSEGTSKVVTTNVVVPPVPNQPYSVSGLDNGNNTITISWMNSVWAKADYYQLGLRPAGIKGNDFTLSGTLLNSFGFQHADAVTTVGPLTYAINIPEHIPSGTYEVWVYDLNSQKGSYASVAYVRHDLTAPVASVSGNHQNGQFTINWSASDAESAISSKTLDVRASDGSVILLDNSNVTANANNSTTISHPADGKTYSVTLKAVNAEGLQTQATTSIVVGPMQSLMHSLSATQNFRSTDVTITWSAGNSVSSRAFQVQLTTAGGSHINAVMKTVSGTGPFTQVLSIGSAATGTYRAVITDAVTSEVLSQAFSFTVPPTLQKVNPYMTSNTAPSGVASVSSMYDNDPSYDAWTAFNTEQTNGWVANSGAPQWLQYSFVAPSEVAGYRLTGRAGMDSSFNAWQFQGSNDGATWTTLDTVTGYGTIGNYSDPRTFMLSSEVTYTSYRLLVTEVSQHGAYLNGQRVPTLADFALLGYR